MLLVVLALTSLALALPSRVRYWGYRGERLSTQLTDENELWFDQQLVDHFDTLNHDTWSQRYFVNTTHYEEGGPVFLMIGGEGPESQSAVNGHFHFMKWVEEFHGIGVCLEHRFYGKSYPSDFTDKNMYLLSSTQALNDLATFRDWFAKEYHVEDAKWIVIGGSYSGNLSAWARQQYPHLFVGSIASSAPVWAQVDFPEYLWNVEEQLTDECRDTMEDAFIQIDKMVESESGRKELNELFNICPGMSIGTSYDDVANFLTLISDPIAGIIQYASADGKDVKDMCDSVTNTSNGSTNLERYANLIKEQYGGECIDPSFKSWIDSLKNTDMSESNVDASSRSWFYQTCAEFGYYQTGTGSIFSDKLGLQYFRDTCSEAYGLGFPDTEKINTLYGGRNTGATNTFFANGKVDPWHLLSVEETNNKGDTVVLMDPTSHCYDLYVTKPTDPQIVEDVKELERKAVKGWLGL